MQEPGYITLTYLLSRLLSSFLANVQMQPLSENKIKIGELKKVDADNIEFATIIQSVLLFYYLFCFCFLCFLNCGLEIFSLTLKNSTDKRTDSRSIFLKTWSVLAKSGVYLHIK